MAKSYRMLSPFAVVTGNVSGAQDLEYPLNGGSAFDAPAGSKQYAQNYKPRFIMHERKSDGKLYFQLRQRSCVHKTTKSILAMAALGAAGAIIGAILADKSSALYIALQDAYVSTKPTKDGKAMSFRKWLSDAFMPQLKAKSPILFRPYNNGGTPAIIALNNPFVSGGTAQYNVTISDDVLVKFWSVLANNPIVFTVDGAKGISHAGDTFADVIASDYNVLGLSAEADTTHVMLGNQYVVYPDGSTNYQADSDNVIDTITSAETLPPFYLQNTPGASQG